VIGDGLLALGAVRNRLEQTPPPHGVTDELPERLAAGMKQLEEDLIQTAQEAAGAATNRIYERGLLGPRLSDVSDGGARYRWELERSDGLLAVRRALADLEAMGF
jgi:hypothetical protein